MLPVDDKFAERYRKAVDEIAAYRPVVAFRLRGKERYFDFRGLLSQHFGQFPGSASLANDVVGTLDGEAFPAIEETLSSTLSIFDHVI